MSEASNYWERANPSSEIWDQSNAKIADMIGIEPAKTTSDALIAAELAASNSPRKDGFNYGTGWGKAPKPAIYFDAVKLSHTLEAMAHDASTRAWRLTTALRNVRLAETLTEKREAVATLQATYDNLMSSKDISVAVAIDELIGTIEHIVPEPKGYTPHMGIQYALKPVRELVQKIADAFKRSDG